MNTIGLVAAISAFLAIWFGHVAVRKIEAASPTIALPAAFFVAAGLGLEYLSLFSDSLVVSTALGIVGITLLWDALELARQQARVRRGHAPANPRNPRHARMLAEPRSHATAVDVLSRQPAHRQ